MPVTEKQLKTQKLTQHVKDKTLEPMGRIRAARRLLKHTEHSARSSKASRALARELLKAETAEVRKSAADLLEFLTTQRETDEDTDGPDEIPVTKIGATSYTDPFENLTVDEILAEMNQNALADPPAKFIYFQTGQAVQYLRSKYTDLFSNFTDGDIADMQDSPYDRFLGFTFGRVINPEFFRAYKYWCWLKFAHNGLPDKASSYFLRFCREEDVRRWAELGTLVTPSENQVGVELRRREHISGAVQKHEIPFAYCLYLDILAGNKEPTVNSEDTPFLYLNEFCGLKTDEERKAEIQHVSQ